MATIVRPNCTFEKDCTKIPFPEKCKKFCIERILRNATVEEKKLILGFDSQLAQDILKTYNSHSIRSFDDLQLNLRKDQSEKILNRFSQLSQFQLDYFKLSPNQRENLINNIRDLGLDKDDLPLYS